MLEYNWWWPEAHVVWVGLSEKDIFRWGSIYSSCRHITGRESYLTCTHILTLCYLSVQTCIPVLFHQRLSFNISTVKIYSPFHPSHAIKTIYFSSSFGSLSHILHLLLNLGTDLPSFYHLTILPGSSLYNCKWLTLQITSDCVSWDPISLWFTPQPSLIGIHNLQLIPIFLLLEYNFLQLSPLSLSQPSHIVPSPIKIRFLHPFAYLFS